MRSNSTARPGGPARPARPTDHLAPLPVAGRLQRSPALERQVKQGGGGRGRPVRRRRARREPGRPPSAILLVGAILVLVLGWRWWEGRVAPGSPATVPTPAPVLVASGPSVPPAVAPGAPALMAASLLENALPELPASRPDAALQGLVERVVDADNGSSGFVVRHLVSGATATYHDRDVFRSASLAKVPILVETFRQLAAGSMRPDETLLVTADSITDGAGVLQGRVGERISVAELLRLSVSVSDNVAARLLMQRAGGVDAVNRTMASLGLTQTRLYADDRPNTTTASEMATLMTWIATRTPLGTTRGAPARLAALPVQNSLAALLSMSQAQSWLTDGVPKDILVSHKSGQLPGARHDAGVVYAPGGPYVVVVLTDDLADQGDAEAFIGDVNRVVYDYFKGSRQG
jgi:beta-lactamase class A